MAIIKQNLPALANIAEGSIADDKMSAIPFLNIYGQESKIGHVTRQYPMSAGHINASASPYTTPIPKVTRLSMAAFMLQCVHDKTLKAVRASKDVFMTFKHPKGNTVTCRAYMEAGQELHLSYTKMPNDPAAMLIPAAVLATAMNENCMKLYTDFMGQARISTVYQFCDTVLYEFLMTCQADAVVADDLSIETVKQAVSCGHYGEFPGLESPLKGQAAPKRGTKQKQTVQKEAIGPDLSSYRNGEHIIRHEWGDEQKKRVIPPDFLDTFVPIPEFFRLMNKLDLRIGQNMAGQYECGLTEPEQIRRDVVNVLLYGNPGTGKTVLAHALSAATGMPLYEVKFDKYTESDEVEGKNKIIAGKLAFTGTDFLEGYEKGGILLLEEINCADQNVVTGALNNAIEYPFFIMKDGYQKVNRNPFTVIIATMNVGTEGTMWLNQSFASRFKQKYRIADPSPEDFIRFLTNYGYDRDAAAYVHDAYVKVIALLTSNRATAEYALNLSTRACLGALENMSEGEDAKTALIDTVVGAVGIVDPQAADNISKNVIANLPDFKPKKETQ